MQNSYGEELVIGDRIAGRYEILSVIGQGSMGVVYKCRHDILGKVVAIKTLRLQRLLDDRHQLRFEREARAASRLEHPSLISVHDFGYTAQNIPYLIMDYVSGQPLFDIIRREKRISPERVIHIFSQVCDGLAHAHHKGVIHRDLKPANILVVHAPDKNESIKIVDLGVAKIISNDDEGEEQALTKTGEVCGSPIYLSPEQCMYQELTPRTDIYSLGVCMYEALSGLPPLRGQTVFDTIYMHVHEVPKTLSEVARDIIIPPMLESLVMRCLAKDPDERPETMLAVKDELLQVINSVSNINTPASSKEEKSNSVIPAKNLLPEDSIVTNNKTNEAALKQINVLPPESLFTPKENNLNNIRSLNTNVQKSEINPEPKPSVNDLRKISKEFVKGELSTNSSQKESKIQRNKSVEFELNRPQPLLNSELKQKLIIAASVSIFIGISLGLSYAFFVNKKPNETTSNHSLISKLPIANGSDNSVGISEKAQLMIPSSHHLFVEEPGKTAKQTNSRAAHSDKKADKKNKELSSAVLKPSSEINKIKAPAKVEHKNSSMSMDEMQKKLDAMDAGSGGSAGSAGSAGSEGSANKYFSIMQQNNAPHQPNRSMLPSQKMLQNPAIQQFLQKMSAARKAMSNNNAYNSAPSNNVSSNNNSLQKYLDMPVTANNQVRQIPQQNFNSQNDAQTLNLRGRQLLEQGNLKDALNNFEQAYQLEPNNDYYRKSYGVALNSLAIAENRQQNFASAVNYANKAVALCPDNMKFKNNLEKFKNNLESTQSDKFE